MNVPGAVATEGMYHGSLLRRNVPTAIAFDEYSCRDEIYGMEPIGGIHSERNTTGPASNK